MANDGNIIKGIFQKSDLVDEIVGIIKNQLTEYIGIQNGTVRFVLESSRNFLTHFEHEDLLTIKDRISGELDPYCIKCDCRISKFGGLLCSVCD